MLEHLFFCCLVGVLNSNLFEFIVLSLSLIRNREEERERKLNQTQTRPNPRTPGSPAQPEAKSQPSPAHSLPSLQAAHSFSPQPNSFPRPGPRLTLITRQPSSPVPAQTPVSGPAPRDELARPKCAAQLSASRTPAQPPASPASPAQRSPPDPPVGACLRSLRKRPLPLTVDPTRQLRPPRATEAEIPGPDRAGLPTTGAHAQVTRWPLISTPRTHLCPIHHTLATSEP